MTERVEFPKPPEVTEQQLAELDAWHESLFGPIVAAYRPEDVTNGAHPEEIKRAWQGTVMPVRAANLNEGSGQVQIATGEAFNALVANGASEDVLRYWISVLPEDPQATLGFLIADGSLDRL